MRIALVTGSRSDWRMIEALLASARADGRTDARLYVTGTHLSERHGRTIEHIERAGWSPTASIPILETTDTPMTVARATGRAVSGFVDALGNDNRGGRPDWVIVTGDRYESFAAGVAATML